jgi:hypothetical protein
MFPTPELCSGQWTVDGRWEMYRVTFRRGCLARFIRYSAVLVPVARRLLSPDLLTAPFPTYSTVL